MRRAQYYSLSISPSRQLVVTLRKFRVAKLQRSRRFKQLVIPVYFSSVRQLAVRQQRRKLAAHGRRKRSFITNLRQHAVTPAILMTLGLVGLTFFIIQASLSSQIKPAKAFAIAAPIHKAYSLPRSEPTHLTIPSVGIDADTITVERDANGGIELPPVLDWTTGWYKYSPTPGEIGPAIIVGHVDSYKGVSVFWRLRDVQPGDEVLITRADASIAKFKITALKQFDQANFPTQEVYGNTNYAGLRLITCGGAFDTSTGQYTQNTVVFAELVQ